MLPISEEDKTFLQRLDEITAANLNNSQFGVNELAKEIGMSRSNVHRKLKTINNQSLSQFIRETRLKAALKLLKENKLTVSEIAYDVGFGSPSYFIKCFHEYFGCAPGEYLKYASGDLLQFNAEDHSKKQNHQYRKSNYFLNPTSLLLTVLITISLGVVIFVIFQHIKEDASNLPNAKSIAVLPLKNLGSNADAQILAEGVVEDILTRLSHIGEFTVKSRNSSDIYRNSTKSTPEIAAELEVSYLVEGTILKEGDRVRLYIQLIDAIEDKHLWSKEYEKDLTGIFTFISEVSHQIANELKVELTTTQIEQIEKVYTNNPQAYLLYQKGRYFWHRRGEDNLTLSIKYFNEALELDSSFALAYSGLANVYMVLPFHSSFPNDKAYIKSIEYANKALSIDDNLDEPHVAIATAEMYFNLNWEMAEKEFIKAIELNSNNAENYQFYAEYLHLVCKHGEARLSVNKALELDPNAYMKYWVSSFLYYDEGKFEESIKAAEKMLEFGGNGHWAYRIMFQNYVHLKNDEKAFESYLKYLDHVPRDSNYLRKATEIYEIAGVTGLLKYEINRLRKQNQQDYKWIAKYYAMLQNADSTLLYLEKEFEKPQAEGIMDLKVWIDFNFLHGNSRYNSLLEKINLPVD